ncbi:MAG: hypothetical protein FWB73_00105 [Treponema sp.]|nr:hypothetical protein [Treponema sp.]
MGKVYKSTKLFCLRKGNLYLAWDGKTMTEKPQEGIRVSTTLCRTKYKEYEALSFPEAYNQWYQAKQEAKKILEETQHDDSSMV